jgi:hypothetical protein
MEATIDVADAAERGVMVLPDDPDVQERRQIGHVRRPLCQQPLAKPARCDIGNTQIEDEERDHDREHAVAERLHPARVGQTSEPLLRTVGVGLVDEGRRAATHGETLLAPVADSHPALT